MGLVYLFALVLGGGLVAFQVVMGASEASHGDFAHVGTGHADGLPDDAGILSFLPSLRFWLFALLGFGLSGSLLHWRALASPIVVALIAIGAGLLSGVFASFAFQRLRRSGVATESRTSLAAGKIGRMVVTCRAGSPGQVRVEIGGSSVDLLAESADEELAQGESVVIVDVRENVARVSRAPSELG